MSIKELFSKFKKDDKIKKWSEYPIFIILSKHNYCCYNGWDDNDDIKKQQRFN